MGAAGVAIDTWFEVTPLVQDARELRAELLLDRTETRVADAVFCWTGGDLSVRGTNVGDHDIDALNLTFVVDGEVLDGFTPDIGGLTGVWPSGYHARFERPVAAEPERVVGVTGSGSAIFFEHIVCPILATILVSPSSATMEIGDSRTFTATGYDQYGDLFDGRPYAWSSTCGTVTLLSADSATLTAGTTAGECAMTATSGDVVGSSAVTISPDAPASVEVTPDGAGVPAGGTRAYAATARDAYGNVNSTAPITWSTDAGSITSDGVLTAQTTAQLGRTVTATWTSVSGSATVDIHAAAPATATVSPDGAGVTAGSTRAYSVVLHDAYGNVNSTAPVSWSTDAGSIDAAGVLTAQTTAANGLLVTATSGAASDSATVDVLPAAPATIVVTPEGAGVTAGGTQAYAATIYDAYGNVNGTATPTWSTNAGSIGADGVLAAQTLAATGRTVTATSGAASGQALVDVIAAAPASAVVTPDGAGVTAGGTQAYAATLYDAYGNVNATATIAWTTNAGAIDAAGVLTAQTTAATGRTVTATSGAASASVTVDVLAGAPASITVTPDGAGVTAGGTLAYSASVRDQYGNANTTASVTWETNAGSITGAGVLTAQTTAATGRSVTAHAGVASGSASVDVVADAPATMVVSPDGAGVPAGGTRAFSATVYDQYGNVNATAAVSWSTNAGSITSGGVLTAQTTAQLGRSVTGTTTGSVTDSATVDVHAAAPATVVVSPDPVNVDTTLTRQFSATVTDAYGNANTTATVTWSATRGSLTSGGLYTAPTTTGPDTVTASAGSASGTSSVTVRRALHIESVTMYKANVTATSFKRGDDTAEARAIVKDHLGDLVGSASVTIQWVKPGGSTVDHTDTVTTATNGTARAYWAIPNGETQGTWTARVSAVSGTYLWWDSAADVSRQASFNVTNTN